MTKTSKLPAANVPVTDVAGRKKSATKVFSKSEYPKTVKENIKLFLNLFINFFG
jgi:hypothetical protein